MALSRLAGLPGIENPRSLARTYSEDWEIRDDVYDSTWIISGPGTLVQPNTTAYRIGGTGKWSKFDNTGNRPIHVRSMRQNGGLRAEDLEPVETREVPPDVLAISMLWYLGG